MRDALGGEGGGPTDTYRFGGIVPARGAFDDVAVRAVDAQVWAVLAGGGPVTIANTDGTFAWINHRAAAMLGYAPEELIGRSYSLIQREEDSEQNAQIVETLATGTRDALEYEVYLRRKDGGDVYVHVTSNVVYDDDTGAPLAIFSQFQDITERKRSEDRTTAARQRLARLFSDAPVGLAMCDENGILVESNTAFCELLGRDESTVLGRHFASFTHPDDVEDSRALTQAVIDGDRTTVRAYKRYVRSDGSAVHAEVGLSLLASDDEEPARHVVAIVRDVTAEVAARQELGATLEELERSNADLEHFASIASHDLQGPLHTVSGYIDLLDVTQGDSLDEDGALYVAEARAGVTRMRTLIESLLEYGRVGRLGFERRPIDLKEIAEEVRASLGGAIDENRAEIVIEDLPTVRGDHDAIERVMLNVIGNAIRYRRDDVDPRVEISARPRGQFWAIRIADNGIGIAEDQRSHVFGMFSRVKGVGPDGTGIGLATARRVIDRHGGDIWIEDGLDGGTAVVFTLPAPD